MKASSLVKKKPFVSKVMWKFWMKDINTVNDQNSKKL